MTASGLSRTRPEAADEEIEWWLTTANDDLSDLGSNSQSGLVITGVGEAQIDLVALRSYSSESRENGWAVCLDCIVSVVGFESPSRHDRFEGSR